jgi:hypothetical protein
LRARAEAWASAFEEAAREDVQGALEVVVWVDTIRDDDTVEILAVPMRNLMLDLLDAGAPVRLRTVNYPVEAQQFAAKVRESDPAKATFAVDCVARTVDFASGAHRKAAAEAEASGAHRKAAAEAEATRGKSATWKWNWSRLLEVLNACAMLVHIRQRQT